MYRLELVNPPRNRFVSDVEFSSKLHYRDVEYVFFHTIEIV